MTELVTKTKVANMVATSPKPRRATTKSGGPLCTKYSLANRFLEWQNIRQGKNQGKKRKTSQTFWYSNPLAYDHLLGPCLKIAEKGEAKRKVSVGGSVVGNFPPPSIS